jgi:hypothetical protein
MKENEIAGSCRAHMGAGLSYVNLETTKGRNSNSNICMRRTLKWISEKRM